MNYKEYQLEAKRTCPVLLGEKLDNIHMIFGMQTEISEITDVFKKNLAYQKQIDWVNIKEELGDLMWYIVNFCTFNNINLEECMEINIQKLKQRYPEGFNIDKAVNRNLEAERKLLEK